MTGSQQLEGRGVTAIPWKQMWRNGSVRPSVNNVYAHMDIYSAKLNTIIESYFRE